MAQGLDAQQRIFAGNPDDRRAFEALEEHFFLEGDWPALVRVYRDRLTAPSIEADPAQKGALLFRLGQILEDRILDLDAACETYWTLARLDRSNRPALRQLRGIHERRGQWDMVLQLAELESATTMPPYERAQFESELGRIWQRQLGDRGEAERAYGRALAIDAEFPPALEGLAGLCLETGRTDEAIALLERLTTRLRGPERAPFWLSLGRLYAFASGDRARARRCFEAALEDDPLQTAAVEWGLLLATEAEDWETVAALLEHRFDLAAGARHRASIAVEASQIHLHQRRSPSGARVWIDRASELAEDDGAVLRARADVERADGDDAALAAVLDRLVRKAGDRASLGMILELATALARCGRPAEALARLERTPTSATGPEPAVLELRARLLRDTGARRQLAEVLETLVTLEAGQTSTRRVERLRELARLCEEELDDDDAAESHWLAAFSVAPDDSAALAALERLQRKREDWPALRHTYERALAATEASAPARLASQLGELLLERFDEPEGARRAFERALARDAHHRPALAGLRRLAERTRDDALLLAVCEREAEDCDDARLFGELARQAAAVLVERGELDRALDWTVRACDRSPGSRSVLELRADLEHRLGLAQDESETLARLADCLEGVARVAPLHRRARLLVERDALADALACLEAADAAAPDRIEILEDLCDLTQRLGRPADEARWLRRLGDRLPIERRSAPLARLASLLEDPIGDLDGAIEARRALLALPDAPAGALDALAGLLELAGRSADLAVLLEHARERVGDDAPEARRIDLRRGRLLLDALGDCEAAAALFQTLHERDPGDDEVLALLERALRAGRDADGLCALLARRASWEQDPVARAPFLLERAQLLEEVLGRPEDACDVYDSIVSDAPGSAAAVLAAARLEALCESTGQWSRLHALLRARVAGAAEPERTALRMRIADLCRDRLQDPLGCATQLEAVAAAHPERVPVWQQIQDLYLRVLDRPGEWLRVAQAELSSVPTPRRELVLRVAIGRLLLDGERRPTGAHAVDAIGHFERAFQLDPSHAEAAELLAGHYERTGKPVELARVLEAHLTVLDEARAAERDELRLRLARVWSRALDDDARARPLFEAVRAARGPVPEIAEPLAEILERAGDGKSMRDLVGLCRDVLARRSDARARRPWQIRLARACVRLDELDAAVTAYQEALQSGPGDAALEDELVAVYERQSAHGALIAIFERRLDFATADAALALRLRLADLYEATDGDPARALDHLERVLELVPHHRAALDRALALAPRVADAARTCALLDRALALPLDGARRAACLERRGLLAGDAPEHADQAIADLREAIALDPARSEARRALRARLASLERWPAVLDTLALEAAAAEGTARQTLLEEGAALAEAKLGADAAVPWLARLRAERPEDPTLWARLGALHRAAGRFEAALRALDEELVLRDEPASRLALQLERARLLEHELEAPGRAVLAYQAALPLAADRGPILAELDRLFARLGRAHERTAILEQRVIPLPGRAGLALRRTLAELYCAALARPESALVHLRENVAATRGAPDEELHHLGALAAALRACNLEEEWAAVAERELALIDGHPELRAHTPIEYQRFLREEIARILDVLLGDAERALERIRELCDDPVLARDGVPARVHARLHDLLRRTGRKAELADRLTRFVATGQAAPHDWLELATLREAEAADFAAASAAYREAGREPALRLEALRGRRRCAERMDDPAGLAETLREELELDPGRARSERAALARRLGAVCRDRLSAPDEARTAYRTALELEPRDAETIGALIALEEARGDRLESIALHRRALAPGDDGPADRSRRATHLRRLASLHAASPDGVREAIDAYHEVARLDSLTRDDERALAGLHDQLGEQAAFFEVFGRWCDRSDGTAEFRDHLRLARRLAEAGDARAALARRTGRRRRPREPRGLGLSRRTRADPGTHRGGDRSFERAASHALPIEAARHFVAAALLAAEVEPERGFALFERGVAADAACFEAQAGLTRTATTLSRPAIALRHAELALELARGRDVPAATILELALSGGRAARTLTNRGALLRLFGTAVELEPEHPEALSALAEAHFDAGDWPAAKPLIERRLARSDDGPERARLLAMAGRCLEAEGRLEPAAECQRAALALDPALDAAHESLVRIEERAARPEGARAALTAWARASADPALAARAALRAAEHALAAGDPVDARELLDQATSRDPELGEAWVLACEVGAGQLSESELRALCERALAHMTPSVHSARIALRLARLAEIAGQRDEAVARYGEAWRWDPRCGEAALCESRLARMAGDWIEADGILSRFLDAHPDPGSATLAQVHLERGRLLSGPLEAFDQAIGAYRRALELQPGLAVAKGALAALLLHAPDRWREALALHREILASAPTTAASLRALATLAERQGRSEVAVAARCLFGALGHGSREELEAAPRTLGLSLNAGPPLAAPELERLRRIAHLLRDELARILPDATTPAAAAVASDPSLPVAAILAIEDELSAPSLSRMPASERGALFLAIGGLFLDPGGNGGDARTRDALDRALGLWTRRKLRRLVEETSLDALAAIDHEHFGHALRALAAALLLDRERGALRPVLLALLALDPQAAEAGEPLATELGGRASSCEATRLLLIRITHVLCEKLERGR
ncbi:MAG: tetratricopeptide repeat protein [Myxococcota bacterium]